MKARSAELTPNSFIWAFIFTWHWPVSEMKSPCFRQSHGNSSGKQKRGDSGGIKRRAPAGWGDTDRCRAAVAWQAHCSNHSPLGGGGFLGILSSLGWWLLFVPWGLDVLSLLLQKHEFKSCLEEAKMLYLLTYLFITFLIWTQSGFPPHVTTTVLGHQGHIDSDKQ